MLIKFSGYMVETITILAKQRLLQSVRPSDRLVGNYEDSIKHLTIVHGFRTESENLDSGKKDTMEEQNGTNL